MYERFTDRARKVMQLAGKEAKRSDRDAIDAEHILLGLLMEGSGVAASVLTNLGVDLEELHKAIADRLAPATGASSARKLPLAPRAKQVLEHAFDESRRLGHNYVGTEHLLLGLLRVDDAIVADVFVAVGVTTDQVRTETARLLGVPNPKLSSVMPQARAHRRRLMLAATAVAAILGAFAYRHFWLARPIGSGPAGPSVSREAFETVWTSRPVLVVGFGDSVTAGFGAPRGHGYFDRLIENPKDEFEDLRGINLKRVLPNLRTSNVSLSGSTSLEHAEVLVSKIDQQDDETFGIILLTTGGNDVIHNYGRTPPREGAMYGATLVEARPWIDNFAARLEAMVEGIEAKFPGGCQFFIANIFDPTDGVGDAEHAGLPAWPEGLQVLGAYNRVIEQCAQERANVHLVDMHGEFLGHGIHCTLFWNAHYCAADPHYWLYENLEDPNDCGYDALRRLFLNQISRVLPQGLAAENRTAP